MTREEQNKCLSLLYEFYPNSRRLQSKPQRAAWRLALEQFRYPEVKAAIVRHATRCNYFPDVADVLANLTPEGVKVEGGMSETQRMERMLAKLRAQPGDAG